VAKTKPRSRKTALAARPKPGARRTSARPPLAGVRVIDLTRVLAGPFCAMSLGDMGAEVIKIEDPRGGDDVRTFPPLVDGWSSYFLGLNRNKKSVALDLKHPDGKAIFFRLLEGADVVLENLRVGTVAKLGIDYAHARGRQPRIVYCSVSGFGQDGPYRDRAALDLVVQAESGMISITGEPGGSGVRAGVSIADITAGMYAAFGIVGTSEQQRRGIEILKKERLRIQGLVGRAVVLKYTPKLRFVRDDSVERGNRVLQILEELERTLPSS